jgi:four helix bundle protein
MASKSYRDLVAWQKSMDLADAIYRATKSWPRDELYGLTNQVRRAAVSVPSNLAEGQGRASPREFMQHISIARGSLAEAETQLLLAQRFGYVTTDEANHLLAAAAEVGRLLYGLTNSLSRKLGPH